MRKLLGGLPSLFLTASILILSSCDTSLFETEGEPTDVVPPSFALIGPVVHLGTGLYHACAICADGALACWGSNQFGQSNPDVGSYQDVGSGGQHTCAIEWDETLACWGAGSLFDYGQAVPPTGRFEEVCAGHTHTCGIQSKGVVECWGSDDEGELNAPSRAGKAWRWTGGSTILQYGFPGLDGSSAAAASE